MHSLALFLFQNQPNPNQMVGILAAVAGFYAVLYVIQAAIFMVPAWFIAKKAGFSPWLSLINIVPLGTLILLYVVAFSEWKVIPAPQVGWAPPPYPTQPPYPPQA